MNQVWQVADRCPLGLAAREAWRGKTVSRTMMNCEIRRRVRLRPGRVLDIGAGDRPSYWRFLEKPAGVITVDIDAGSTPSVVASLERGLPLAAGEFDNVLAFNVFEHIYGAHALAREVFRVLKPEGRLFCSVPFLVPIHADPYDFFRYTGWTLSRMFRDAGFADVVVTAYGGYFASLAEHVNRFNGLAPLRSAVVGASLLADRVLDRVAGGSRNAGRFVLGYFVEGEKPHAR